MINLLSNEQKRDIRAARINVTLLRYAIMLVILALVIGVIYGLGFWLVEQDKRAMNVKLQSQGEQSKTFSDVEQEADNFRQNLLIAKQILSKETSYSTFLTTLAKDMPSGSLLTNFSIGGSQAAVVAQKGMTLDARTTSYAKVLELKASLEKSTLFENVNIVSASRPSDITILTGLSAKYPYEVSLNVKLSTPSAGGDTRDE